MTASPSGEAGSGGLMAGSGAGTVTVTPCRPAWPQAVQSRTLPGGCRVRILWLASAGQVRISPGRQLRLLGHGSPLVMT